MTLILLHTAAGFFAPPAVTHDSVQGLVVSQSMRRGAAFNRILLADSRDIAVDRQTFLSAWSPGQYLAPRLFEALGMRLGRALLLTAAFSALLGILGFYGLFKAFGFDEETTLWSLALMASQRVFGGLFFQYHGGESLLFACLPWICLFSLRCGRLTPPQMAGLLLAFWAGFLCKSIFVVCALAILLAMILIEPGELFSRRAARHAAKAGAVFAVFYAAVHRFYMSEGWHPARAGSGRTRPSLKAALEALSYPMDMLLPSDHRPAFLSFLDGDLWAAAYPLLAAAALLALLYALLRRPLDPRYKSFLFSFFAAYNLAFLALALLQAQAHPEPRYFRPVGLLLIPGAVELLRRWPSRWARGALCAAAIFFCLYQSAAWASQYRWRYRQHAVGALGITQRWPFMTRRGFDHQSLKLLQDLDERLPPGNNLFYLTATEAALEVQKNRILIQTGHSVEKLKAAKHRGRVDNLVVALPAAYVEDGRAKIVLDSFPDAPGPWRLVQTPALAVYYQGNFLYQGTAARRRLSGLPAQERAELAEAIRRWIDDALVFERERAFHYSGAAGREDYASYVAPLESHLAARGLARWTPLPAWNPAEDIPDGFGLPAPTDAGKPRPAVNKKRTRPFPEAAGLEAPGLCRLSRPQLDAALSKWHDFVLEDMGGAADSEDSTAAPIAWCWHAHLGDVRRRWEDCPQSPR